MMNSHELDALAAAAARRRKIEQENLKKQQKQEELEVTGVSRSGRVRKKSSKLMDFESPDDIDTRFRRLPPPQSPMGGGHHQPRPPPGFQRQDHDPGVVYHQDSNGRHDDASGSDSDQYDNQTDNQDSMEWESSGSEEGADAPQPPPATPAHHSLYMMEKSNKKKMVVGKDGRRVRAKAQRKDKGQRKSRITAYMMWTRGARHELIKNYPDMDFSAISKRLGEMWANVNFQERHMWQRKAKRFSMQQDELQQQQANKIISNAPPAPPRQWSAPAPRPPPPRAPPKQQASPTTPPQHQAGIQYRVTGCGAVDVAAHLRLLGESLAIIGARLKEHEGQIAVSGSVSVLLDTLLCSLAPLICVTRAVPAIAPPASLLQDTLDNIAYIMPGL